MVKCTKSLNNLLVKAITLTGQDLGKSTEEIADAVSATAIFKSYYFTVHLRSRCKSCHMPKNGSAPRSSLSSNQRNEIHALDCSEPCPGFWICHSIDHADHAEIKVRASEAIAKSVEASKISKVNDTAEKAKKKIEDKEVKSLRKETTIKLDQFKKKIAESICPKKGVSDLLETMESILPEDEYLRIPHPPKDQHAIPTMKPIKRKRSPLERKADLMAKIKSADNDEYLYQRLKRIMVERNITAKYMMDFLAQYFDDEMMEDDLYSDFSMFSPVDHGSFSSPGQLGSSQSPYHGPSQPPLGSQSPLLSREEDDALEDVLTRI